MLPDNTSGTGRPEEELLFRANATLYIAASAPKSVVCSVSPAAVVIESDRILRIPIEKIENVYLVQAAQPVTPEITAGPVSDLKTVGITYKNDTGVPALLELAFSGEAAPTFVRLVEQEQLKYPARAAFEYAGFWYRFLAYLIDSTVLNAIGLVITLFLAIIAIAVGLSTESEYGFSFFNNTVFIANIAGIAYYLTFWAKRSRTLGHQALGIKIVTKEGKNISFGRALLRYFGYIVCALTLDIGFLWIAWDKKKQGLHDKIAGTYVIKVK